QRRLQERRGFFLRTPIRQYRGPFHPRGRPDTLLRRRLARGTPQRVRARTSLARPRGNEAPGERRRSRPRAIRSAPPPRQESSGGATGIERAALVVVRADGKFPGAAFRPPLSVRPELLAASEGAARAGREPRAAAAFRDRRDAPLYP